MKSVEVLLRALCAFLLCMKQERATKMFGLTTYCDGYGRMSEGVHLAESHKSFDDWHLRVPLEREEVKM